MSLTPVRVVLDTNIVLSALVFSGGRAGAVRQAWQRGLVLPLACTSTVQKLRRVLAYPKFKLSRQEQEELLADYLPYVEVVQLFAPLPELPNCRDPLDLPFLQLVVVGRAQVLVSGDQDVLTLVDEFEREFGCSLSNLEGFCRLHLGV